MTAVTITAAAVAPFVQWALDGIDRPYPTHVSRLCFEDGDFRTAREMTPVFYGCFDWHSAVHAHFSLVRALRLFPDAPFAADVRAAITTGLQRELLLTELRYLAARPSFERPYGLAWLLALDGELLRAAAREVELVACRDALAPVADLCRTRLLDWLPRLSHPIRSGVHSQTAFAMALMFDWAEAVGDDDARRALLEQARRLYGDDRCYALHLEPSGEDFLSPSLGAADLMRRCLAAEEFSRWLDRVLPELRAATTSASPALEPGPTDPSPADPSPADPNGVEAAAVGGAPGVHRQPSWLAVVVAQDRNDGRLVHLDGLALSRAFMMLGVAEALPVADPRRDPLLAAAQAHREAGLAALANQGYMGGHWLGTFGLYLLTR